MATKLVVNCQTGISEEIELTPEEIQQNQKDVLSAQEQQQKIDAEMQAKQAARQAGITKLIELGLTEEQALAIAG